MKPEAPRLATAGSFTAVVLAIAANVAASAHWLFPLARAVNCFEPRESTWVHALQSLGFSFAAVLLAILGLILGRRANVLPRARGVLLWGEGLLAALLVVPVVFIAGAASEANECGTSALTTGLVASTLLLPTATACLPALLLRTKSRSDLVGGVAAAAAALALWLAIFLLLRPWEYPTV